MVKDVLTTERDLNMADALELSVSDLSNAETVKNGLDKQTDSIKSELDTLLKSSQDTPTRELELKKTLLMDALSTPENTEKSKQANKTPFMPEALPTLGNAEIKKKLTEFKEAFDQKCKLIGQKNAALNEIRS